MLICNKGNKNIYFLLDELNVLFEVLTRIFYPKTKRFLFDISICHSWHPLHSSLLQRTTSKLKTVGAVIYCCATTKYFQKKLLKKIISFRFLFLVYFLFLWFCGMFILSKDFCLTKHFMKYVYKKNCFFFFVIVWKEACIL